MEARLVEECTLVRLVPSLEKIAKALSPHAGHHDLFVALLTVIMGETGYRLDENSPRLENEDSGTLDPISWRSPHTGCYELRFEHGDDESLDCKIVGIPIGDVLVINLCPVRFPNSEVTRTRSAAFQTLKYVNPYASDRAGRFRNLRELAHRFKDNLTTPIKGEILTNAGITNGSLAGLPTELKLRIIKMLGEREIGRIAQCSREFRELSAELRDRQRSRRYAERR